MRYLALSLVAAALLTATACSNKSSSNSSDQSTSSDQTATTAPSAAATEAASTAAGEIPSYPGAVQEATGSNSSMGKSESGTVMSTDDSFDKVYAWYQQHMPAGSEKAHIASPPSAVFTVGDTSTGLKSVSITVSGGKTMITVGAVKM